MAIGPDRKARIRAFRRLFLGIAYDLWREARLSRRVGVRTARHRMSKRHRKRAIQFRETASQMGGVVIKLGQFLSARADVMPEEYLQELSKLQDEVPPVSFEGIKEVIEQEFDRPLGEVYATFDPVPVAAASLGQVHAATLADGTEVAVKVQRPGIQELCDVDLATLAWLMDGVHRFTSFGARQDIPGLVQEFARTLGDELDFMREGWYADRFRANFRRRPIICVPHVHWEYTTARVLTLEHIKGIKISDYAAIEAAGVSRSVVADEVFQSYMQQILLDGFFHADPHPGNLFVVTGEEGTRIAFVDFGMVGEITEEERGLLKEGVIAGSRRDFDALVGALSRLGFIRPGSSVEPIKRAIAWIFENYSGMTAHRVSYDALESIQEDIRTLVYEQPFTLPSQFGFLGRAVGTMIGLVSGLDPHYDFVTAVRPYVREVTRGDYRFVVKTVQEEALRVARALLELPERLDKVLAVVERGDLMVKTAIPNVGESLKETRTGRVIVASGVFAAGLLIAGVIFFVFGQVDWAVPFWAVALVVMIVIMWPGGETVAPAADVEGRRGPDPSRRARRAAETMGIPLARLRRAWSSNNISFALMYLDDRSGDPMRWTSEAEELIQRVPPFARPMARRAVEKAAHRAGVEEITPSDVRKAMPKRGAPKGQALADLVEAAEREAESAAVRREGYELTVCGGLAGCPLAVGDTEAAFEAMKRAAEGLDLDRALAGRIEGPVLSHSRCKMTVCACPNGCSESQIKDVALVARAWPEAGAEACTQCMACVKACPDAGAITVDEEGPHIDWSICVGCGRCITACTDEALVEGRVGWDVTAGGRLGRHPRLGLRVNGDRPLPLEQAIECAERVLEFLIEEGESGERLGAVLDRAGAGALKARAEPGS